MNSVLFALVFLQQVYTAADFVHVSGANLKARFDAAVQQGRRETGEAFWVAYQFPVRAGVRVDARYGGLNITRSSDGIEWVPEGGAAQRVGLFLLTRQSDGAIEKPRILDLNSTYRFHDHKVYWAGDATAAESLDVLMGILGSGQRLSSSALTTAIGIHDTAGSIEKLIALARGPYPNEVKRSAVSQLGQEASRRAAEELGRMASDNNLDADLQRQVVSAISRRSESESVPMLIRIAREHPALSVRKQAITFLGQKKDSRAVDFLEQQLLKR